MRIVYFSTSIIPSQYANSVNVMKMSNAMAKLGYEVTLIGMRGEVEGNPYDFYNVDNYFNIKLIKSSKFGAAKRLFALFKETHGCDLVYTRYTIAAFISALILRKKVIYEYHAEAYGKINSLLESLISKSQNVRHVFITNMLKNEYLIKYPILKQRKTIVAPDAAERAITQVDYFNNNDLTCGYIGSFQKGKGIELVLKIAEKMPEVIFHVVGGTKEEVVKFQNKYTGNNIVWHGFLSQHDAMDILRNKIDIALLPNQRKVIVGNGADIGRWTSPMKLFEYMSYGKIIISSRLPVLEEIVQDGNNALLAEPDDVEEWIRAINQVRFNKGLASRLQKNALLDFNNNYTWDKRVKRVLG